jgi:hypothetical protein
MVEVMSRLQLQQGVVMQASAGSRDYYAGVGQYGIRIQATPYSLRGSYGEAG